MNTKKDSILIALQRMASVTLKKHPLVDYGGCCVVAAHFAKRLSDKGVSVSVRAVNGWTNKRPDLNEKRSLLENPLMKSNWETVGVDFFHVLCEFELGGKRYWYDSSSGIHEEHAGVLPGSFTIEEASSFAKENTWNTMFNRSEIPNIKRRITRTINSIDWDLD